jgi:hypothetical protein
MPKRRDSTIFPRTAEITIPAKIRNPQVLCDHCHGQTFRVEAGQLVPVYDQPRPAAVPPLIASLVEPGNSRLLNPTLSCSAIVVGIGFEPLNKGFADLSTTSCILHNTRDVSV